MVSSGYRYQYVKNTLHINNGNNTSLKLPTLPAWMLPTGRGVPVLRFRHDGYKYLIPNGYYRWLNIDERELYQAMRDATRRNDSASYNKHKMVSKKKLIVRITSIK
jgi:hypothetical protein